MLRVRRKANKQLLNSKGYLFQCGKSYRNTFSWKCTNENNNTLKTIMKIQKN